MYGSAQFYTDIKIVKFLQVHSVTLQYLTLRCIEFTDERFKVISQCVGLVSLRLYKCCLLTPRSIESIASLSKLRCLHLTGARLFRSLGILELINSLPLLIEDLNLSYSDFGNEHCTALAHRLPRLAVLELWRCGPARRGRRWLGGGPGPGGGPELGGSPELGGGPGLDEGGCTGLGQSLPRLARQLRRLRALDTDVLLNARQLRELAQHPALQTLRCLWRGSTRLVRSKLIITSALKKNPWKYFRDEGEGPSSELFYYWTREVDLHLFKGTCFTDRSY